MEAQKVNQKIQNDLIQAGKEKKHNNNKVLIQKEAILEDTINIEPKMADLPCQRPQRQKHEPKMYKDYQCEFHYFSCNLAYY
jgi:hypothetical protein